MKHTYKNKVLHFIFPIIFEIRSFKLPHILSLVKDLFYVERFYCILLYVLDLEEFR